MLDLTPELRDKFFRFREEYEFTKMMLEVADSSGYVIANRPWKEAIKEVPLTGDEMKLYMHLVAMHSVNGGELFAIRENE